MGTRIQPKDYFNSTGELETKFNKVIGQYDKYTNKLINDNRTWRILGLMSIALIVLSVIGWFYTLTTRRDHLLVVEVNELGRAKFIGDVTNSAKGYDPNDIKAYMVEAVIRDFIEYTRTIGLDSVLMDSNMTRASMTLSDNLKIRLSNEIKEENPFQHIGKMRRNVFIESNIQTSGNTWQYDWYDITTNMSGLETSRVRMRGLFTVTAHQPRNKKEQEANPLGIFIVDYNIQRVNEVLR